MCPAVALHLKKITVVIIRLIHFFTLFEGFHYLITAFIISCAFIMFIIFFMTVIFNLTRNEYKITSNMIIKSAITPPTFVIKVKS